MYCVIGFLFLPKSRGTLAILEAFKVLYAPCLAGSKSVSVRRERGVAEELAALKAPLLAAYDPNTQIEGRPPASTKYATAHSSFTWRLQAAAFVHVRDDRYLWPGTFALWNSR